MNVKEFARQPLVIFLALWGILSFVVYATIEKETELFDWASYFVFLGSAIIASVVLLHVFKFYGTKSSEGKVWLYIFIGISVWTVAEFVYFYYYMMDMEPFPSIADAFYLAGYAPLIMAFFYKARFTKANFNLTKTLTIGAILVLIIIPTVYYVAIPIMDDEGVLDSNGIPLDDAPYYYFETAEDGVVPETYEVCSEEVYGVAVNATIVMELDANVDIGSAEEMFGLYDEEGGYVDGTITWNGTTLTFTPDESLEPGAEYEAEVYVGYGTLAKGISLLYPLLDLILLAVALYIALYWGSTVSGGWYFVSLAIILTTLADITFAMLEWQSITFPMLDLLWLFSYLAFAIGGLYQKKIHESFI